MILLENAESQKRHYEKKYEEMSQRLRETEKALSMLQKTVAEYQVNNPILNKVRLFGAFSAAKAM